VSKNTRESKESRGKINIRNKTRVAPFQMDLCDLRALQKENNSYNYLLTIIDVFSKRAFVFPLKNKTATYTLQGIEEGFKYLGFPKRVHTDHTI